MQVNFDEFPGFSTKVRSQWNCGVKSPKFHDTYCFILHKSSSDNWRCSNFRSELWAIICAAWNFVVIFRANFRFVCQFFSISGQCFAAFEIWLDINHLCGAVVCVKSSCDPSAYAVSRSTQPILGNCCVKLTWLFSKESPTVYHTWIQKHCSSNMFRKKINQLDFVNWTR